MFRYILHKNCFSHYELGCERRDLRSYFSRHELMISNRNWRSIKLSYFRSECHRWRAVFERRVFLSFIYNFRTFEAFSRKSAVAQSQHEKRIREIIQYRSSKTEFSRNNRIIYIFVVEHYARGILFSQSCNSIMRISRCMYCALESFDRR